jgi:hypothetical protein
LTLKIARVRTIVVTAIQTVDADILI